jgi:D-lactate dehydrogenase (cytochrome)
MEACIRYSKLEEYQALPTLFFEFHGSEAGVREQSATLRTISDEFGGSEFRWATLAEDRTRLWKARHAAYYATLALRPGTKAMATDACVPISRLAECILETKTDIEKSGLTVTIVGHVGDGNFHLVVLYEEAHPEQRRRAEALARAVSMRAIAMGGTCTGEHGIGWHKLDLLAQEHGEAVDLMRSIKHALDPCGIMNPGKTVPF